MDATDECISRIDTSQSLHPEALNTLARLTTTPILRSTLRGGHQGTVLHSMKDDLIFKGHFDSQT
jgi:hypothetical protein